MEVKYIVLTISPSHLLQNLQFVCNSVARFSFFSFVILHFTCPFLHKLCMINIRLIIIPSNFVIVSILIHTTFQIITTYLKPFQNSVFQRHQLRHV